MMKGGEKVPLKIPFFRLGTWKHPVYGDLKITQGTFDQILANFKSNVLGRPPFIRIGHDKSNNQTFGYAPAEGWVHDLKQEGDILFAEVEPTSPEAEDRGDNAFESPACRAIFGQCGQSP